MAVTNFAKGSLVPYDPQRGLPYGTEPIQKYLPVSLDVYFNDTVTGANCSRSIMVTTNGNVTVEFVDGSTATLPMQAGIQYVMRGFKVQSGGTTATGIFWGY